MRLSSNGSILLVGLSATAIGVGLMAGTAYGFLFFGLTNVLIAIL